MTGSTFKSATELAIEVVSLETAITKFEQNGSK